MKRVHINNFEEELIYEKLDNGFEIFLIPMKNKKSYMATVGTKYGGVDRNFTIGDVEYHVPSGIAHFLEHKMFDQENHPFEFYAQSGCDVNAATTSDYTYYYFMGSQNFDKNLEFLLSWIFDFHISEEQVKKEQGIILEEASMHKDNPDRLLYEKMNANVYVHHPARIKTIGTDDDIVRITKEDLECCYQAFYRPDNMFFIAVGNFDDEETLEIVRKHVGKIKNIGSVAKLQIDEVDEVACPYEVVNANVQIPKISLSYKIHKQCFEKLGLDKYFLDLYLYMILSLSFGSVSDFRESLLKRELFVSLGYQINDIETHYVISFIATTNQPEKLVSELEAYLRHPVFDEASFERTKKTWIASEVRMIDSVSATLYNILDDIVCYDGFKNEKIKDKKSMTYAMLLEVLKCLSFEHQSLVVLKNESTSQ